MRNKIEVETEIEVNSGKAAKVLNLTSPIDGSC